MSHCSVTCGGGKRAVERMDCASNSILTLEIKSIHHINFNNLSFSLFYISIGYKMAVPTCKNRLTGSDVEESLCNAASRPESTVVQCNTHACPPK